MLSLNRKRLIVLSVSVFFLALMTTVQYGSVASARAKTNSVASALPSGANTSVRSGVNRFAFIDSAAEILGVRFVMAAVRNEVRRA